MLMTNNRKTLAWDPETAPPTNSNPETTYCADL